MIIAYTILAPRKDKLPCSNSLQGLAIGRKKIITNWIKFGKGGGMYDKGRG